MGQTGTGKTFLAKQLTQNEQRLFVLDHLDEYEEGIVFDSFEDLRDYFEKRNRRKFRCICRFSSYPEFDELLDLVWETGNCVVLAEEAALLFPSGPVKEANAAFVRIVNWGRHRNIRVVGIATAAGEVHKVLRRQARAIYSFRQVDEDDLMALKKRGFDVEKLAKLPDREFQKITS